MRRTAQELAQPGQHIYAYCNVRTKQVLYSLQNTLKPVHLKQLPDTGANNTPTTLRKDSWRPLWSLSLPSTAHGRAQGQHAFKKLREYRKLHETCWEPPSQLSRPYTEKEIEKLQEKLDDRGGSKKESVYDIIKRKKHNMKVREVMDQKANSIADLAAVLLEQDELGSQAIRSQYQKTREAITEMLAFAEGAENGRLAELAQEEEKMKDVLAETTGGERGKVKQKIFETQRTREKILFAQKAVAHAQYLHNLTSDARHREEDYWQRLMDDQETRRSAEVTRDDLKLRLQNVRARTSRKSDNDAKMSEAMKIKAHAAQGAKSKQLQQALSELQTEHRDLFFAAEQDERGLTTTQIAVAAHAFGLQPKVTEQQLVSETSVPAAMAKHPQTTSTEEIDYAQYLSPFPPILDSNWTTVPKLNWVKKAVNRESRLKRVPIFTTQGLTVRWSNMLDAEYARTWPEDVMHKPLGTVRHSHPRLRSPNQPFSPVNLGTRRETLGLEKRQQPPSDDAAARIGAADEGPDTEHFAAATSASEIKQDDASQVTLSREAVLKQLQNQILGDIRKRASKGEKKRWGWNRNAAEIEAELSKQEAPSSTVAEQTISTKSDGEQVRLE